MNQIQLLARVASVTGESLRTVRALGFGLVTGDANELEPENLLLLIDCPFCRASLPYPGLARDGSLPMGECLGCDVYFPFEAEEVYAASCDNGVSRPPTGDLKSRTSID